jgi:hypothetical protein
MVDSGALLPSPRIVEFRPRLTRSCLLLHLFLSLLVVLLLMF